MYIRSSICFEIELCKGKKVRSFQLHFSILSFIFTIRALYPSIILKWLVCLMRCIYDPKWAKDRRATLEYIPINATTCDVFVTAYDGVPVNTWLPRIVGRFLKARECERTLKNEATDAFIKLCHEMSELAYKNSSNAVYGFFGSRTSGMTCFAVARAITGLGRRMAQTVRYEVIKNNGALLGGDTVFSCFLSCFCVCVFLVVSIFSFHFVGFWIHRISHRSRVDR